MYPRVVLSRWKIVGKRPAQPQTVSKDRCNARMLRLLRLCQTHPLTTRKRKFLKFVTLDQTTRNCHAPMSKYGRQTQRDGDLSPPGWNSFRRCVLVQPQTTPMSPGLHQTNFQDGNSVVANSALEPGVSGGISRLTGLAKDSQQPHWLSRSSCNSAPGSLIGLPERRRFEIENRFQIPH